MDDGRPDQGGWISEQGVGAVGVRLAEPAWLLVLLLVPLPWIRDRSRPRLVWPTLAGFAEAPRGMAGWPRHVPALLRALTIACLGIALARPQTVAGQVRVATRGVGIVVAIDRSSTMETRDFPSEEGTLTRLDAARRTIERFVIGRPDDLVGLVPFANLPETACPPTLDHAFLIASVRSLDPAGQLDDGTNIGDAVVWGLGDLKAAPTPRRVLILVTDGRNEVGLGTVVTQPTDPLDAARLARRLGVTLHTVAIGRRPEDPGGAEARPGPDFALLQQMAALGGGRAFVAADADALAAIFREIDELEKAPVSGTVRTRYHEWFVPWAVAALAAIGLERVLIFGRLRRVP
jgi:Ca-activated chloride channel family protein